VAQDCEFEIGDLKGERTYPLLRQQNADVVAFDVVGDEVGFAVVVHVNDFDTPGASPGAKGRPGRALKNTWGRPFT